MQRWWTAVHAVLRAESHDEQRLGALVLCYDSASTFIRDAQTPYGNSCSPTGDSRPTSLPLLVAVVDLPLAGDDVS
jgi:hypothetical protein